MSLKYATDSRGNRYPLDEKGVPIRAIRTKAGSLVTTREFPDAESHLHLAINYIEAQGLRWCAAFRETFAAQDMRGFIDAEGQFIIDVPEQAWTFNDLARSIK